MRKLLGNDQRAHLLPLGIEQLPALEAFDTVFSMGVLYHRRSPLDHLWQLKDQLAPGGELVLETLVRLNREKGMTVVMVSSELMELRSICDRIAIVAEGKVVDVLETNASDADFGLAMSGIKPEHVKQKGGEAHV